jgi:hypothetical protein
MQLSSFLKQVKRVARLELRMTRLGGLTERAEAAGNTDLVAAYEKEMKRRLAEHAYRATRVEADLEDHPEWDGAYDAMRSAVLEGSRGSKDAKSMLAAALGADTAPEAAPATE